MLIWCEHTQAHSHIQTWYAYDPVCVPTPVDACVRYVTCVYTGVHAHVCVCVRAHVRGCQRVRVRMRVTACVRACVHVRVINSGPS